jgi:hypothetical protein
MIQKNHDSSRNHFLVERFTKLFGGGILAAFSEKITGIRSKKEFS